jgi:hypothetical protein
MPFKAKRAENGTRANIFAHFFQLRYQRTAISKKNSNQQQKQKSRKNIKTVDPRRKT